MRKHKTIRIILISMAIILSLLCIYLIVFSPFHFWFMKEDDDTGCFKGTNLAYNDGTLYVSYNDNSRLDVISSFWTFSKFSDTDASFSDIITDNLRYTYYNNTLYICDLNGNNKVKVADDLTYFSTDYVNNIYFADNSNQVYVYSIDNKKTELIPSYVQGDIFELSYHNDLIYVISGYYEYEADKAVYKCNINSFDCKSFGTIHNVNINMNDMGINSNDCYVNIIGDNAVFFGKELGISYYSVNLSNSKTTYLGEHSKSVSCTDDTSLYYLKNLYASSIYNKEVHDELWKLDIRSGQTEKIADFDVEYTEMLCTDNYIYLYRPMKLFPKENTLFNLDLGYEIKQVPK